jgi:hypothetical protein
MNYTFSELNDYDLEILVRDLINQEYRLEKKYNHGIIGHKSIIQFSSFKPGKDQGIDLMYKSINTSTEENISIVVQVKHYSTDFSKLVSSLKKKKNGVNEIDKVNKLNPNKYIFATSLPLSFHNKNTLSTIFSPYIKSIEDIYGREDLNKLLTTYSRIEKRHIKLYLQNSIALERIYNNSIFIKSKFELEEIIDKIPLFVQTNNFFKGQDILEENKVLIIKGPPGVGKSTLAEMLCLKFIDDEFGFYYIDSLDDKLETVLKENEKQIFYFDDFLGSNYFDLSSYNFGESRIGRLIRVISKSKLKRLVMTTRTNILNKATSQSEKISRLTRRISNFEIDIDNYSISEKEQIYISHINNYITNQLTKNNLLKKDLISKIISHRHFSPRLIEYISRDCLNGIIDIKKVHKLIIGSLENPDEVWYSAYKNQLKDVDRAFLTTIFLFGNEIDGDILKSAFELRIQYEISHNSYHSNYNEYKDCISHLDGSFISIYTLQALWRKYDKLYIQLLNPSITDFLYKQLTSSKNELLAGIKSFYSPLQLSKRFNHSIKDLLQIFNTVEELTTFLCQADVQERISEFSTSEIADIFLSFTYYFSVEEFNSIFSNLFKKVDLIKFARTRDTVNASSLLSSLSQIDYFLQKVSFEWDKIISELLENVVYEEDLQAVMDLFNDYSYKIKDYIASPLNLGLLRFTYEKVIEETISQLVFENDENIRTWDDVEKTSQLIKKHILKKIDENSEVYEYVIDTLLNHIDWEAIIKHNAFIENGE